jgi:hypothetical protein
MYTGCTNCINDSHPCKYDVQFCCTGRYDIIKGSFSGSSGTTSFLTINLRGNYVQVCTTIGGPSLDPFNQALSVTAGTIYNTCEECTSGGTKCLYEAAYCCDNSIRGVNQGWLTGDTAFIDPNGDCYVTNPTPVNGPATLTGTTGYPNCEDCLTNEIPCLYNVTSCCGGLTGVTSYPGDLSPFFGSLVFSDSASGNCWTIDSRASSGSSATVTFNTSHDSCCDCINSNIDTTNCGTFEVTCCHDLTTTLCVPKYPDLVVGDVIVIHNICYEITGTNCGRVNDIWDCIGPFRDCDACGSVHDTSTC